MHLWHSAFKNHYVVSKFFQYSHPQLKSSLLLLHPSVQIKIGCFSKWIPLDTHLGQVKVHLVFLSTEKKKKVIVCICQIQPYYWKHYFSAAIC